MNRVSQLIADKCTSALAGFVAQSRPIIIDKLTFNSSLKFSVLNDARLTVEVTSPTTFEVFESQNGLIIPNGPALSEARLSDFFLGSMRVRKQYDAVLRLKESGASSAWLLVSAYYCAYFACVELCKVINRTAFSFEDEDIGSLRAKAVGPAHANFFASAPLNFVGYARAGKLVFQSVGTRPHVAAWENVLHAFRGIFSEKAWPDAERYIGILCNPDCSPSRIRNTWNYKRSDYFGTVGDRRAEEFKKLVGNPDGASGWVARRGGSPDLLDPCVVAVLCEALAAAVTSAAQRAGDLVRQQAS